MKAEVFADELQFSNDVEMMSQLATLLDYVFEAAAARRQKLKSAQPVCEGMEWRFRSCSSFPVVETSLSRLQISF